MLPPFGVAAQAGAAAAQGGFGAQAIYDEAAPEGETGAENSEAAPADTAEGDGAAETDGTAEGANAEAPPDADDPFAPPFVPEAGAVCLMSGDGNLVVYEKNADAPMHAASLVKMMTAILTVEKVGDLDNTFVTADKTWIFDELYGKNASNADIRKGETLSVRELLYAMLLPSGNEAALLLGDYVSGHYLKNFVYLMNNRAKNLGCTGTTFVDPNGLNEGNITTARDMCRIMQSFMEYPVLVEIAATPQYELAAHEAHDAPYNIFNTNRLLAESSPYYSEFKNTAGTVVAGKTGSLGEWQNFVSFAQNDTSNYLCAVLESPNAADALGAGLQPAQERPALYETARLYDWAFSSMAVRPVLNPEEPITELRVRYSTRYDAVKLLPTSALAVMLPAGATDDTLERTFHLPEYAAAPVKAGDKYGTVTVSLKKTGQVLGTADLVAAHDVARDATLYTVQRAQEAATSTFVKVLAVVTLVFAVGYAAIMVALNKAAQKKKASRLAAQAAQTAYTPQARHARPGSQTGRRPNTGYHEAGRPGSGSHITQGGAPRQPSGQSTRAGGRTHSGHRY